MAELQAVSVTRQALEQLEDQLTCGVCLETFSNPKMLDCAHVFCEGCIKRLVTKKHSVTCPNCRKSTTIPGGVEGVAALQKAFYISNLTEIQGTLEKVANDVSVCSLHGDKALEFHCQTCDEMICARCAVRNHRGHQYNLKGEALDDDETLEALEPVNVQLTEVKKVLEQLEASSEQVMERREAAVAEVSAMINAVMEELNGRKAKLMHQVYSTAQDKLLELSTAKEGIVDIQAELRKCLKLTEEDSKSDPKEVKAKIEASLLNIKVKDLKTSEAKSVITFPFSPALPDGLLESIRQLGEVQGDVKPTSYAVGAGLHAAVQGEAVSITLHTVDTEGLPCVKSMESIQCELTSEIQPESATELSDVVTPPTPDESSCSVCFVRDNEYTVIYTPTKRGNHHLHVKVEGQHIRGSPFPVLVKPTFKQLGIPVRTIKVVAPFGLAATRKGRIIVAHYSLHRVFMYDSNGKQVKVFGKPGREKGEFNNPRGVAVDGDGNILVVDGGNNRVQKFTCEGAFIVAVGKQGNGPLEFNTPHGVAYYPVTDKIYIADTYNCRIQILNPDMTFSGTIGRKGTCEGELSYPWAVGLDSKGNCYVADTSNHRIQSFTADGQFLSVIGARGSGNGKGELDTPSGIAIDKDTGIMYVTDLKADKVVVYSVEDGSLVSSFGGSGSEPGQFKLPHAVALDQKVILYVSDLKNGRIQCF